MAIKNTEELSQDIENQLLNREVVDDIQDALKEEKATIADTVANELLDPAALAIRLEAAKRAAREVANATTTAIPDVAGPVQEAESPRPSSVPGAETEQGKGDSEIGGNDMTGGGDESQDELPQSGQQVDPEQPKEQAQSEPEPAASAPQEPAPQKSAAPQPQQTAPSTQKQQPLSEQPQPADEKGNAEQEPDQESEDDVPDGEEDDDKTETDDKEDEDEKEEEAEKDEDGESSDENGDSGTLANVPSSKKSSSEIAPEDEASTAGDLNKEKAATRTAGKSAAGEASSSMGSTLKAGSLMKAASGGREGVKNAAMNAAKTKVAEEAGAAIGSALMPGAGTALGALAGRLAVNTPIVKWILITLLLLVCISIVTCIVFFFFSLYAICDGFITGTLLTLGGFDCSWADSWLPGI